MPVAMKKVRVEYHDPVGVLLDGTINLAVYNICKAFDIKGKILIVL